MTPVERSVQKQPETRPPQLTAPKFYVVTEKNFDEFKERFIKENGQFVLYVLTPGGYKALVRNQSELERFIKQQNSTIVYYESML